MTNWPIVSFSKYMHDFSLHAQTNDFLASMRSVERENIVIFIPH